MFIERRLTALVGHLLADGRYFGTHLEHDPLDAAPGRKIVTRRAPRWQARQMRQHHATKTVNQLVIPLPNDWSRMRILLVE